MILLIQKIFSVSTVVLVSMMLEEVNNEKYGRLEINVLTIGLFICGTFCNSARRVFL